MRFDRIPELNDAAQELARAEIYRLERELREYMYSDDHITRIVCIFAIALHSSPADICLMARAMELMQRLDHPQSPECKKIRDRRLLQLEEQYAQSEKEHYSKDVDHESGTSGPPSTPEPERTVCIKYC